MNEIKSVNNIELVNKLAKDLAQVSIGALKLGEIDKIAQGELTPKQLEDVKKQFEQIAEKGEVLFGSKCDFSDGKVQEFIKSQFLSLVDSVKETALAQPNFIIEASMSEAVFSHKGSYRPVLTTDALATCIGVGAYDPINQFGFVIHFSCEAEIDASGDMLMNRILAYREKNPNAPLLIHLRGGIKEMSEPLLDKVKAWVSSNNLISIIASDSTLQDPVFPGVGIPRVSASIKLDVRTGTCETYDRSTNPFAKRDSAADDRHFSIKLIVEVATKKPEIKIVYDSKAEV
jgi:hypothetical protein